MDRWVGFSILREEIGGGAVITTDLGQILVRCIYGNYREFGVEPHKTKRRLIMQAPEGFARADWMFGRVGDIVFSPLPFDESGRPKLPAHLYSVVRIICMAGGNWNGPALAAALRGPGCPPIDDETARNYLLELKEFTLMKPSVDEKGKTSACLLEPTITREEFTQLFCA
jgi:hypothetical protein